MDITIQPQLLSGEVTVIPSKSMAHRLLICAALADNPTQLILSETSRDVDATIQCLRALGAEIHYTQSGITIIPIKDCEPSAMLPCEESGTTLRFLLPIVGVLGVDATFYMEGRLPYRPLSPLWEEMERMGCVLCRPKENIIHCTGKLRSGAYSIDGSVSSQFISGLLFALSLLPGSTLQITGKTESTPYIAMTKAAMEAFCAPEYHTPGSITVEGDWSNGAFWVAANALGSRLTITGLSKTSIQGDRIIDDLLALLKKGCSTISASDTPDLIPILSVVAAANHGAVFTNIQRLRLKESDRVQAILSMIRSLGGRADATADTLTVYGTGLTGGTVDSYHDHRIAMSAAIAATICRQPVTILRAECVNKSYPKFWEEYARLGGNYGQFLR